MRKTFTGKNQRIVSPHMHKNLFRIIVFLFFASIVAAFPYNVYAFEVEPLPDDNLVNNPWFRDLNDPTSSSLDGWTDAGGKDKHWSSSQKLSNPSPDVVVSKVCDRKQVHCGTAARLAPSPGKSGGQAEPEKDSYLYQIVSADPSKRKLKFFTYWVSHRVDIAEVKIYGSSDRDGAWEEVWTPFSVTVEERPGRSPSGDRADEWHKEDLVSTVITKGYPFYKIEIRVRLPDSDDPIGDIGYKMTGVYFAAQEATSIDLEQATSTAALPAEPTPGAVQKTVQTATREPTRNNRNSTPVQDTTPTVTKTDVVVTNNENNPQLTIPSTVQIPYDEVNKPAVQLTRDLDASPPINPLIGALSAGLVFAIVLVVILRARRN